MAHRAGTAEPTTGWQIAARTRHARESHDPPDSGHPSQPLS